MDKILGMTTEQQEYQFGEEEREYQQDQPFNSEGNGIILDIDNAVTVPAVGIEQMLMYANISERELSIALSCLEIWQTLWRRDAYADRRRQFVDFHNEGRFEEAKALLPPWAYYVYTKVLGSLGVDGARTIMMTSVFGRDPRALKMLKRSPEPEGGVVKQLHRRSDDDDDDDDDEA